MIRLKSLLFEVSLDQLKTQFVDTGKITDSEFVEIVDSAGGKSAYATWLTKMIATKTIQPEDLYKYNAYFKVFDRRKREYPFQDINQYKTADDIAKFIETSVEIANKEQRDPSQQKGVTRSDKYQEFFIGSVNGFDVYELPKGRKDLYGASCELGSGTQWCTATGKTRKHFDRYISHGPLFIFIKPGSDEKYQFSYETNSFMDKNDFSIMKNLTANMLDLFEFIESNKNQYRVPLKVKLIKSPDSISAEDLTVNGDLDLGYSTTALPNNFALPDNLNIKGDLNLGYSTISALPNNLNIKGDLILTGTPISALPDNLKVKNLFLGDTPISALPDNLNVRGHLYLSGTKISSLPNNLKVAGFLNLTHTPISKKYTKEEILKSIEFAGGSVKGDIYI